MFQVSNCDVLIYKNYIFCLQLLWHRIPKMLGISQVMGAKKNPFCCVSTVTMVPSPEVGGWLQGENFLSQPLTSGESRGAGDRVSQWPASPSLMPKQRSLSTNPGQVLSLPGLPAGEGDGRAQPLPQRSPCASLHPAGYSDLLTSLVINPSI